MDEYRVEFTIQRRRPDDEDFTDIGFGSSGAWESIAGASYAVGSMIDNWDWETRPGMPDPEALRVEERDREPAE